MPTFLTPGALYQNAKRLFLGVGTRLDVDTDTINASLVRVDATRYTPNDEHLAFSAISTASIPSPGGSTGITINSTGTGVKGITTTSTSALTPGGAFYVNPGNTYFTAVEAGSGVDAVDGIAVWKQGASDPLIAFVYLQSTGLNTNGGDIQINWSTGANRIFRI